MTKQQHDWHVCDLCRLHGHKADAAHVHAIESETDKWLYCECGAVAEKPWRRQ